MKIINLLIDAVKSFIIGAAAGIFLIIVSVLTAFIIHKGIWLQGLYAARTITIITGALGLLVSSGAYWKRNSFSPLRDQEGWRRNFKILNFEHILIIFFTGIIIAGGVLDILIY